LKRKFEEGLASPDMAQYLRLHAKDDDFSATVLKARHFADVAGTGRQKKVVRILETPTSDTHQVSIVNHPSQPDWTPLLEGFKQVMSKALQSLQKAISMAKGNESNSRPSTPVADANTACQSPGTQSPLQVRRFDRNPQGQFGPRNFQSRGRQFGLQRPPSTGGWQGRYTPPLRSSSVGPPPRRNSFPRRGCWVCQRPGCHSRNHANQQQTSGQLQDLVRTDISSPQQNESSSVQRETELNVNARAFAPGRAPASTATRTPENFFRGPQRGGRTPQPPRPQSN